MINTVEKIYDKLPPNSFMYKVVFQDNSTIYVPHDTENRHYQEILEWVAAGNTITDPGE
mgnify:CR=1 FL=1|jgi:hypothetical protein